MSCWGCLNSDKGSLSMSCAISISILKPCARSRKLVGFGPEIQVYGDPALTGKVKKFLNMPMKKLPISIITMSEQNIFFLGLLRQTDGVAAQVLENLNVNLKEVRKEVLKNSKPSICNFLLSERTWPTPAQPMAGHPKAS